MVEAAKLNHIDTPVDEEFQIVGAGYKIHTPEFRKPMVRDKLRGKPIASIIILSFIAFGCICAGLFANHDPNGFYLTNLDSAPGGEFFFGTDSLGRDIYSMIWYGGRVSLVVGLLGAAIIAVIGVIYGSIAGTSNTKVESAMMRAVEICGSIPTILFTLIVSATIQANNVISLSFVIGIVGWFSLARIVRSEVRQIRNGEYVLYARSCGGKFLYVMKQHLLPNFLSAIMFVVISSVSTCITTESTLSFLGLGLPIDVISWGSMLSLGDKALMTGSWWVIVFPGVFIVATLLCITNLGNLMRKETNRKPSNL